MSTYNRKINLLWDFARSIWTISKGDARYNNQKNVLLLISVLAASAAGSSEARSSTVTFLYPRQRRWRAVEIPKHPLPTITIFDVGVRDGSVEAATGRSLLELRRLNLKKARNFDSIVGRLERCAPYDKF